jgi:TonB family protein
LFGTDGLTHAARVSQGLDPELDGAALRVVNKWKFTPAYRGGKPVAARINVEVLFRLY